MRHTISVLVENKFGALTRIAGLFSGRGYNIDTLNVGPTHEPSVSRMTIVTRGDETDTLHSIEKIVLSDGADTVTIASGTDLRILREIDAGANPLGILFQVAPRARPGFERINLVAKRAIEKVRIFAASVRVGLKIQIQAHHRIRRTAEGRQPVQGLLNAC